MNARYVDFKQIGVRVKKLREDKGWTQAMLQEASGVGRRRITALENGNAISLDHFIWLAVALDASADYLIFGPGGAGKELTAREADRLINALDRIRSIIEPQISRRDWT